MPRENPITKKPLLASAPALLNFTLANCCLAPQRLLSFLANLVAGYGSITVASVI